MSLQTIKYGEHTVDISALPPVSLHRLASYGLAHFLGNQMASKVVAWSEREENANATPEAKQAAKAQFQANGMKALLDGTIGQHAARGPVVNPLENEMDKIAKAEVIVVLKSNNIKVPKGDEMVEFDNGDKLTMDQLIERRLAKHGDRIKTDAEGALKEKARKQAKLAKNAGALADL